MGCRHGPACPYWLAGRLDHALWRRPTLAAAAILGGLPDRSLPPGNGYQYAGEWVVVSLPAPCAPAIVSPEEVL
ncbi:rCG56453, isoform CRA_a [Rattus norvegicus]|uniref:RCG56453, isoform CRA_a n=1 Tax=Rattus norvegicus TaxID=10116 RepID=A6IAY1_RAT|nr:rCG56453, isoform CRA_a [Rattus norvegicus]